MSLPSIGVTLTSSNFDEIVKGQIFVPYEKLTQDACEKYDLQTVNNLKGQLDRRIRALDHLFSGQQAPADYASLKATAEKTYAAAVDRLKNNSLVPYTPPGALVPVRPPAASGPSFVQLSDEAPHVSRAPWIIPLPAAATPENNALVPFVSDVPHLATVVQLPDDPAQIAAFRKERELRLKHERTLAAVERLRLEDATAPAVVTASAASVAPPAAASRFGGRRCALLTAVGAAAAAVAVAIAQNASVRRRVVDESLNAAHCLNEAIPSAVAFVATTLREKAAQIAQSELVQKWWTDEDVTESLPGFTQKQFIVACVLVYLTGVFAFGRHMAPAR